MEQLELKQFSDYRAYLVAHIQDCKKRRPDWTYGVFARQLGLKDPSSITKIVQGQREPGAAITGKLIRYFQFSPKDAQYFEDLVRLRKIKDDPRLTVMILEKMGKDHPGGAVKILDNQSFQLVSNWYCFTIREMVKLDHFVNDPNWISKNLHFKVTATEAERAIELLIEAGLLERVNGKLAIIGGFFSNSDASAAEAATRSHETMLDIAKVALRKFGSAEREFIGTPLTIDSSKMKEAKEMIREFTERFLKKMSHTNGDLTTRFQIQLFPLSKIDSSEKGTK